MSPEQTVPWGEAVPSDLASAVARLKRHPRTVVGMTKTKLMGAGARKSALPMQSIANSKPRARPSSPASRCAGVSAPGTTPSVDRRSSRESRERGPSAAPRRLTAMDSPRGRTEGRQQGVSGHRGRVRRRRFRRQRRRATSRARASRPRTTAEVLSTTPACNGPGAGIEAADHPYCVAVACDLDASTGRINSLKLTEEAGLPEGAMQREMSHRAGGRPN